MTEGARNPRIIRVLSNNAVLVRVPSGVPGEDTAHSSQAHSAHHDTDTQVLVGRGIGFQRKSGDEISLATADRQYLELNPERAEFFKGVLSLDPAMMETISAAVDLAVDLLGELHPSVYVVLAEHISFAVQRAGSGEQIRNSLVDEIRAAFPLEFQAAQLMVSFINSHITGATLPIDEAAFIALHLNAARQGVTVKQPLAVANELAGLLQFVCARLGATTTNLDGTVDHSLALELTRMGNRVGSKQFRSNLARRSIERDLPLEFDVAQQVLCRMIDVPTLPSHAVGEAAYLAVFLHGWQQSVRPR
ncbi:MAG: PRD domain-containing protein [Corynebacterium glucuronolyticum]|nr:PRD domain-containing protein [Corynebacterium glucuronolyticum]MDD7587182.1 PRD domain-containing protein [Mycobacteriaceae bacterium]MDY5833954.1 PRD domain-containing protein [Corynebacterium glucuronolyticum]